MPHTIIVIVVQSPRGVWLFATPWTAACQASLFLTISRSLPKFMSIASVMPSSHLIFWHPLLLLPSVFPSIRVFFIELFLHIRWPKYWSFSFSLSPSSEFQGWFPLRLTDLIPLLSKGLSRVFSSTTVQEHLFFSAQLSYGLILTSLHDNWKTIALTTWTFVGKVMSLLFNTLYRFVIVFLPKSKYLLILWLQSLFTVILEPKKITPATVTIFSPSISHALGILNAEF